MAVKQEKPSTGPASKTKKKGRSSFSKLVRDPRTRTVFGLFILVLAVFLLLSIISFLTYGYDDQSTLTNPLWEYLSDPDITVNNQMGKLGARVAQLLVYKWFGIASLIFPLFLLLAGMRVLIRRSFVSIRKFLKHALFLFYMIPFLMAFVFPESPIVSGGMGYWMNKFITALLNPIGTVILILFLIAVYLIIVFNLSVDRIRTFLSKEKSHPDEAAVDKPDGFEGIPDTTVRTKDLDLTVETENGEGDDAVILDATTNGDPGIPAKKGDKGKSVEEVKFEIEKTTTEESDAQTADAGADAGEYDPTLDLSHYKKPVLSLLEDYGKSEIDVNHDELESNKNRILNTLKNYNIDIDRIKATIGPTVTLYEIVPAPGIRISKIKNLEDDIALSLSALGIRIIAPIPGKGTIGIEVPNQKPTIVSMKTVLSSEKFQHAKMELPIALGKTISNETYVADLTRMPHLLMAGATGQGKSVGLNCMLASILYKKHPSQVKFVLVDPKKVELTLYNKIERHFLAKLPDTEDAIITDTQTVVTTLNSLCLEMDNRYDLLKDAQCRNIKEYNAKFISRKLNPKEGHKFLPYIVLVVDEFADLIMTAGKEVEMPIARLAQLARAIGIHLIIATQRPSVNIITGTIKANFPVRIAFKVTSKIDSRTILDSGGADQLIGRGDMLMSTGNDMVRLQCAFIDTPEVERLTEYIGSQQAYPIAFELPEFIDKSGDSSMGNGYDAQDRDVMFEEAARIVVQHQQGSASLLQRRLKLGYNRAGRIVDQLEAAGIIGPFEGSKARQVLILDEVSLEQKLSNLG